jgi:hypothetical protein
MLRVNYWLMASRVEAVIIKVAFPRVFSCFIMVMLNRFIMIMLKGG